MPLLHRTYPDQPGMTRLRRGRGFEYRHVPDNQHIDDAEALQRIRSLVLPPAWNNVWITDDPLGHLQAVGTDIAGRRQYRYHDKWQERSQRRSWTSVLAVAEYLPQLRERIADDLTGSEGDERDRAIAACVKLMDICALRVGSPEYAAQHGSYGATTLLRRHVRISRAASTTTICIHFPGKHATDVYHTFVDDALTGFIAEQRRHRSRGGELFRYRIGRHWHAVKASQVNTYLREATCDAASARLLRRWHGTCICAADLALSNIGSDDGPKPRLAISAAIERAASYLANTPAVCRGTYIHPNILRDVHRGRVAEVDTKALAKLDRSRDHARWLQAVEPGVLAQLGH